jgi:hypothetical protein
MRPDDHDEARKPRTIEAESRDPLERVGDGGVVAVRVRSG